MKLSIIALLLLSGCGYFKRGNKSVEESAVAIPAKIITQADLYCKLELPRIVKTKHAGNTSCDAVGFTSLHSLQCPKSIDLSVFNDNTGKLYRNAAHDCYPDKSSSESSRDMHLMRMYAAFYQKDKAYINNLIEFGKKNNWVMCKAKDNVTTIGRCVFSPNLIDLAYDIQEKLNGDSKLTVNRANLDKVALSRELSMSNDDIDELLTVYSLNLGEEDSTIPLKKGFEAHLEILGLDLKGCVKGGITDSELSRLKEYAKREDRNGLYNAVYQKYSNGDWQDVVKSLKEYPATRLPTSKDWCTDYKYQRDIKNGGELNKDWLPCADETDTHAATEFGLTVYIMQNIGKC